MNQISFEQDVLRSIYAFIGIASLIATDWGYLIKSRELIRKRLFFLDYSKWSLWNGLDRLENFRFDVVFLRFTFWVKIVLTLTFSKKKFLSMRPYLGPRSCFNMIFDLFPVSTKHFESLEKHFMFLRSPSACSHS